MGLVRRLAALGERAAFAELATLWMEGTRLPGAGLLWVVSQTPLGVGAVGRSDWRVCTMVAAASRSEQTLTAATWRLKRRTAVCRVVCLRMVEEMDGQTEGSGSGAVSRSACSAAMECSRLWR